MKSFFQLSEQARRHQKQKLWREADAAPAVNAPGVKEADPAKGVANQQTQNQQGNAEPSALSFPEMEDVDLVTDFQKKLKNVVEDKPNAAALVKMKEIPATQDFSTQLTNALAELQKAVAKLQAENKQKKPGQMNPAAGSNETGAGASAPPAPAVKTAAPPAQAAPAAAPA